MEYYAGMKKDVQSVISIVKYLFEFKKNNLEEHLIMWKGMLNNNTLLLIYINLSKCIF